MMQSFIAHFQRAFEQKTLVKCTLSNPTAAAPTGLKNIFLRRVELKKGTHVSANLRFQTRDEVKNFDLPTFLKILPNWLPDQFLNAVLLTTTADWHLIFDKNGNSKLKSLPPTQSKTPSTGHNREKNRLLDPSATWLHALGITNQRGEVLPSAQDKWRQINKFLEIIEVHIAQLPAFPSAPKIADMGSGKGYLTFALFDFLKNKKQLSPEIVGIELRQNLVDFCNNVAQKVDFQGLKFEAADISNYQFPKLDLLIALHACDTATDLAIAAGIRAGARGIVVAPCCHKQIRREMNTQNELAPAMRHGILEERQAEIITDSIRALLLEANGYRTTVFEFVASEHTAKNLMITATSNASSPHSQREKCLSQVADLKNGFGIGQHFLEKLLD